MRRPVWVSSGVERSVGGRAQRLIEKVLGRHVFCYYLLTIHGSPNGHGTFIGDVSFSGKAQGGMGHVNARLRERARDRSKDGSGTYHSVKGEDIRHHAFEDRVFMVSVSQPFHVGIEEDVDYGLDFREA